MISRKTAKLVQILPKRLVTYISKKVVNHYLDKYGTIEVIGGDNLKGITKPTIFVCNHLSNSDGLVLDRVLKEIDPTFVAGVKLSNDAVTSIGINVVKTTTIQPNTTDKEGIKRVIDLINQGESLLLFPEGTRSRTGSLIEAKKGILLIARLTGAPIVPIGLSGTEKLLPIHKSGDMSSESFNYAHVQVKIGKQFQFPTRDKGQSKKDFSEFAISYVMKEIAALLPEPYRGYYK